MNKYITILCALTIMISAVSCGSKTKINKNESTTESSSQIEETQENFEEKQKAEFERKLATCQNLEIGKSIFVDAITVTVNSISLKSPDVYKISVTYKNDSDKKFRISRYDWEIGDDDNYETYISDNENFNIQYIDIGEEFTGYICLPANNTDKKIRYNSFSLNRNYDVEVYATWLIPENLKNSVETTTITATSTTATTTTTLAATTTTTIVTETPTEPPTPAPTSPPTDPPPPPEPVQPVIAESDYVLNTSTMKAHYPYCRDVDKIDPENRWDYYGTVEDIQAMDYSSCGHCYPW